MAETPDTKGADMVEAADAAHPGQQQQQASAEDLAQQPLRMQEA